MSQALDGLAPLTSWMLQRRWVMISGAIISALLVITTVVGLIVLHDWQDYSEQEYRRLETLDREVMADINEYLGGLNQAFPSGSCSAPMLRAMHQAEFHSHFLNEFSLVMDDQFICTSSLGILEQPIAITDHDLGDLEQGLTFTRQAPVPLMDQVQRPLIRLNRFQAFLRQGAVAQSKYSWIRSAEFQRIKNRLIYISGIDDILPQRDLSVGKTTSWYEGKYRVSGRCFREQTCALMLVDIPAYFAEQHSLMVMVAIITLLGITLAAALASYLYRINQQLDRRLRRELNFSTLKCMYQPIVDFSSGEISGCEVLCRWQPNSDELIFPDQFLPLIESNQQTEKLTRLVIQKALTELRQAGIAQKIRIAINAFPSDIINGTLLAELQQSADDLLNNITVELTEREIDDKNALIRGLQDLKRHGVNIAIDDFGTGYSNFQHLRDLHINYLKIDKSFVWSATAGEPSLLNTIIEMARQLELAAIAEGVETQDQNHYLQSLGVEFGQGYLFSKPVPVDEIKALMAQQNSQGPVQHTMDL